MTNVSDIQFDAALLTQRLTKLRAVIDKQDATPDEKLNVLLACQEIIMMIGISDHPKTSRMWGVFTPMAWIMLIALTAIIGLAVAGHIMITIVP